MHRTNGEALLQGFDLEIWGLPTSKPTYDPHNHNFIYQRFQRGIMHYDATCNCTRGLLLADYFKGLLLDQNVPADLLGEAKSSPFLGQWAPGRPSSMARPSDLAGSDLSNAFTDPPAPGASSTPAKPSSARAPIVTLDPGHGGKQIGTSHVFPDGTIMQEKALTLRVASKLHDLLQQAGYSVFQTRTTDASANPDNKDLTGDGGATQADDPQARIDMANTNHSDAFVSVHFNGVADPNVKGSHIFYDPNRPFTDKSLALAQAMSSALQQSRRAAGYTTDNQGAGPDTAVLDGDHYYLLGPPQSSTVVRASTMPAVICEGLFLTNDQDATALLKDQVVNAIAQGYLNGIRRASRGRRSEVRDRRLPGQHPSEADLCPPTSVSYRPPRATASPPPPRFQPRSTRGPSTPGRRPRCGSRRRGARRRRRRTACADGRCAAARPYALAAGRRPVG